MEPKRFARWWHRVPFKLFLNSVETRWEIPLGMSQSCFINHDAELTELTSSTLEHDLKIGWEKEATETGTSCPEWKSQRMNEKRLITLGTFTLMFAPAGADKIFTRAYRVTKSISSVVDSRCASLFCIIEVGWDDPTEVELTDDGRR